MKNNKKNKNKWDFRDQKKKDGNVYNYIHKYTIIFLLIFYKYFIFK